MTPKPDAGDALKEMPTVDENGKHDIHKIAGWFIWHEQTIRAALTAQPKEAVEALKKTYISPSHPDMFPVQRARVDGWNQCIDHLAAKGLLTAPEPIDQYDDYRPI